MLMRCLACGSQGPRWRPSEELLRVWYERQDYAAGELVSEGHLRATERLTAAGIRTLVDVGSGAGSFMDKLGPAIVAYGLEPSRASVEQGRARGRRLVRPDANGWSRELPEQVDAITLFDVIEHVRQPRPFLTALARRVIPGGRIVLFTGDAGSRWARRWNVRWWYHGYAGHVSCFSARGMKSLLSDVGLQLETIDTLVYARAPVSLRNHLCAAPARLLSRVGALRFVDAILTPVASCPLGVDHMLVTARVRD
jgi:SAM-dependent methyltransferase